ncbi:hypothetical protein P167DRAFT_536534 [Morchella conica CCBAS932]|uniref:Uncharacterized protein n=1 Tax=Morchella conica CCBAS932 TaxID=1392247 RepID=A0A3N4KM14_9PEZI|nr:hypothetical protein P167DRAFT_536534 [Morchella conica CCBAS932]
MKGCDFCTWVDIPPEARVGVAYPILSYPILSYSREQADVGSRHCRSVTSKIDLKPQ